MTIDDVMDWISDKNYDLYMKMQEGKPDDNWEVEERAMDILEELRYYIWEKTNQP